MKQTIPRRIVIGVALYLTVALSLYAAFAGNACAVKANGTVIAIAADQTTAKKALAELVEYKTGEAGRTVSYIEKVSFVGIRVKDKAEDILDFEELKAQMSSALTFKTQGAAILVNGEEKVLLKDRQEAETLLGWLKSVYPVEPSDQLGFKENIEIADVFADIGEAMDFETAKKMVLLGTNKIVQYTVKDGDTLWDISRAVHIDQDQIVFTNPGLNPEDLSIDQVLYLSQEAPLITVVATREVTVDEKIAYSVNVKYDDGLLLGEKVIISEGIPGERTVTYRITRENGLETGREVLNQVVRSEPKTEEVVKGAITMVASRGSSVRLAWPCDGGVVSSFGMRWGRMHEGIDLDASYGSDVVAVAGGTVVDAGWDGGYGMKVEISHGGGLVTRYAHLSKIYADLGDSVDRGETIGLVGSTGNSTGPHLHLETIVGGEPQDPLDFLP
ncbi:LysM peptidoglycan-binding domain-containing M23 family metallopeptidase [Pelotomaculum propionicicum]|uniref:LysM peptidoglycan-binding domain-containing M23 family metallopeptidase n=1 Tax=Pelotomaculum propionicicum TaxID=258475 RepID=UPI003BA2E2E4